MCPHNRHTSTLIPGLPTPKGLQPSAPPRPKDLPRLVLSSWSRFAWRRRASSLHRLPRHILLLPALLASSSGEPTSPPLSLPPELRACEPSHPRAARCRRQTYRLQCALQMPARHEFSPSARLVPFVLPGLSFFSADENKVPSPPPVPSVRPPVHPTDRSLIEPTDDDEGKTTINMAHALLAGAPAHLSAATDLADRPTAGQMILADLSLSRKPSRKQTESARRQPVRPSSKSPSARKPAKPEHDPMLGDSLARSLSPRMGQMDPDMGWTPCSAPGPSPVPPEERPSSTPHPNRRKPFEGSSINSKSQDPTPRFLALAGQKQAFADYCPHPPPAVPLPSPRCLPSAAAD
jgi:hypothetical protein